jgi:hypothetical protein
MDVGIGNLGTLNQFVPGINTLFTPFAPMAYLDPTMAPEDEDSKL